MSISEEEITSVIKKSHPYKAAGSDGISFFVLKCLESPLVLFSSPSFKPASTYPTVPLHSTTATLSL
jgi:hypothetical protein